MNKQNKIRLYLAGKVTGLPEAEVEKKFTDAETIYTELGFHVINPVKLIKDDGLHIGTWESIMKICLIMMLACDGVVLLHDWKDSKGAILERDIAKRLDIPIYYPHEPFDKPLELITN
ncbi:MAG: DUF4406 domain-containing protein [Bacteroidia bacterium]|nr:DUF4406 domain-containing protein [Bacteroidia bacterium]